jgi:hypothetical protein
MLVIRMPYLTNYPKLTKVLRILSPNIPKTPPINTSHPNQPTPNLLPSSPKNSSCHKWISNQLKPDSFPYYPNHPNHPINPINKLTHPNQISIHFHISSIGKPMNYTTNYSKKLSNKLVIKYDIISF